MNIWDEGMNFSERSEWYGCWEGWTTSETRGERVGQYVRDYYMTPTHKNALFFRPLFALFFHPSNMDSLMTPVWMVVFSRNDRLGFDNRKLKVHEE